MTTSESAKFNGKSEFSRSLGRIAGICAIVLIALASNSAHAQGDIRYSWFEISYVNQDVSKSGSQISLADPAVPQLVEIAGTDGDGIKFRGSVGTWHNLYAFVDYASSDIDVVAIVTNTITGDISGPVNDEFDFTSIRGGIGLRIPLRVGTDIYGEVSFDSLDLDFGAFAVADDFDTDAQDFGAAIGIRTLLNDKLELRAYGRFTNVGNVNLNDPPGTFDSDTLFGAGFGFELVRGLSITGDFESGEFSSWNIGFRLDLDED